MRSIPVILLLIACSIMVRAQSRHDTGSIAENKHDIYVGIAITNPGLSATYTRQFTRHFDMGVGADFQLYNFSGFGNHRGGVFIDLRPHWGAKKGLFFISVDIGMSVNGGRQPDLAKMSAIGGYAGLGVGYCYRINKRGMGPYVSLDIIDYMSHIRHTYPQPPPGRREFWWQDIYAPISVGFKF